MRSPINGLLLVGNEGSSKDCAGVLWRGISPKRAAGRRGANASRPVRLDTRSDDAFLLGSALQARLCVKLRGIRFKGNKRWGGLSWAPGGEGRWRHTDTTRQMSRATGAPCLFGTVDQIRFGIEEKAADDALLPKGRDGRVSAALCVSRGGGWLLHTPRDRRVHRGAVTASSGR